MERPHTSPKKSRPKAALSVLYVATEVGPQCERCFAQQAFEFVI